MESKWGKLKFFNVLHRPPQLKSSIRMRLRCANERALAVRRRPGGELVWLAMHTSGRRGAARRPSGSVRGRRADVRAKASERAALDLYGRELEAAGMQLALNRRIER